MGGCSERGAPSNESTSGSVVQRRRSSVMAFGDEGRDARRMAREHQALSLVFHLFFIALLLLMNRVFYYRCCLLSEVPWSQCGTAARARAVHLSQPLPEAIKVPLVAIWSPQMAELMAMAFSHCSELGALGSPNLWGSEAHDHAFNKPLNKLLNKLKAWVISTLHGNGGCDVNRFLRRGTP